MMDFAEYANRVIDRCGSTNDLARRLGDAGFPHGSWVSARVQEGGRGRLGRRWESIEGNLFLSMLCRIEDRSLWTWIPLATALGVARAVEGLAPVRIKWPNDLWVNGAKLGGVLCEAVGNREGSYVVAGIGLNCTSTPQGIDQATASLGETANDPWITADRVREGVIAGVLDGWELLVRMGPAAIAREYESRAALTPGTEVEWERSPVPGTKSHGKVLGLGAIGELRVTREGGQIENLYAEDVKIRPSQDAAARRSNSGKQE